MEIFHDGVWGTVCDDQWDMNVANVACHQLDFSGAVEFLSSSVFGAGNYPSKSRQYIVQIHKKILIMRTRDFQKYLLNNDYIARRFYLVIVLSGKGTIWMDDLSCTGVEASLLHCTFHGWGVNNCGHSEDVGVRCKNGKNANVEARTIHFPFVQKVKDKMSNVNFHSMYVTWVSRRI